ncbi:hypothetical protein D9756_000037 [Leucocoprinus leucothites]|uniref:Uncharacterized protein n=1 Tax=Leucocoprinus leucothites TaxID=201217 RepID=A0A8H5GEG5_9AGAR|nr:hypothetical protein D9756_000037 [Leucoagaricus leucothites]
MAIPSLLSLHGRPFIAVPSLPSLLPLPTHPNLFPARRPWVVLNSASKEASQGDQQLPQGMLQCLSSNSGAWTSSYSNAYTSSHFNAKTSLDSGVCTSSDVCQRPIPS